ncbi:D-2-hydroxyacid dehydrogenase [Flavisolibacter nicotianae]|uniref:D-2-hydroxyacid dehydrogenase n=1 Tax=Flavisolibacter nicotianae TaxID=2364882 RepID=UPI000EB45755|nr:D-2-hydroxyacid dehydrogenase [Flavisolibacter nicotianae]
MNIVVTDGFTLNGGDLTWDGIARFGPLHLHDRTPPHLIEERCREAEIIVTNKTPFSRETIANLPKLKCICVTATGYNIIDTKAAAEKGIVVCNVPGYGTASVAQHVFALLLELTNAAGRHSTSVRNGDWNRAADWSYSLQPIIEISGKTMGIVGFGNIGQQVGRIADAFDMKVIYFNPREKQSDIGEQRPLEVVFEESDVVSLHCPLTPENTGMVNKALLQKMKPTAYLINTARGPLVNEDDLAAALNEGLIGGAALDVLSTEPPTEKHRALIEAKNCLITPHNAWMSREARQRIMEMTEKNMQAFLNGSPVNRVA